MAHAIMRGKNGRRYEVDLGDSPVRVEIHASEEPSRFLWRQILKRTLKNGDVLR